MQPFENIIMAFRENLRSSPPQNKNEIKNVISNGTNSTQVFQAGL